MAPLEIIALILTKIKPKKILSFLGLSGSNPIPMVKYILIYIKIGLNLSNLSEKYVNNKYFNKHFNKLNGIHTIDFTHASGINREKIEKLYLSKKIIVCSCQNINSTLNVNLIQKKCTRPRLHIPFISPRYRIVTFDPSFSLRSLANPLIIFRPDFFPLGFTTVEKKCIEKCIEQTPIQKEREKKRLVKKSHKKSKPKNSRLVKNEKNNARNVKRKNWYVKSYKRHNYNTR